MRNMTPVSPLSPLAGAIANLAGRYINADSADKPLAAVIGDVMVDLRLELAAAMSDLSIAGETGMAALDGISALLDVVVYPPPPAPPTLAEREMAFAAA